MANYSIDYSVELPCFRLLRFDLLISEIKDRFVIATNQKSDDLSFKEYYLRQPSYKEYIQKINKSVNENSKEGLTKLTKDLQYKKRCIKDNIKKYEIFIQDYYKLISNISICFKDMQDLLFFLSEKINLIYLLNIIKNHLLKHISQNINELKDDILSFRNEKSYYKWLLNNASNSNINEIMRELSKYNFNKYLIQIEMASNNYHSDLLKLFEYKDDEDYIKPILTKSMQNEKLKHFEKRDALDCYASKLINLMLLIIQDKILENKSEKKIEKNSSKGVVESYQNELNNYSDFTSYFGNAINMESNFNLLHFKREIHKSYLILYNQVNGLKLNNVIFSKPLLEEKHLIEVYNDFKFNAEQDNLSEIEKIENQKSFTDLIKKYNKKNELPVIDFYMLGRKGVEIYTNSDPSQEHESDIESMIRNTFGNVPFSIKKSFEDSEYIPTASPGEHVDFQLNNNKQFQTAGFFVKVNNENYVVSTGHGLHPCVVFTYKEQEFATVVHSIYDECTDVSISKVHPQYPLPKNLVNKGRHRLHLDNILPKNTLPLVEEFIVESFSDGEILSKISVFFKIMYKCSSKIFATVPFKKFIIIEKNLEEGNNDHRIHEKGDSGLILTTPHGGETDDVEGILLLTGHLKIGGEIYSIGLKLCSVIKRLKKDKRFENIELLNGKCI